jgi:O-succinylbenzoic acid--CoA ligase
VFKSRLHIFEFKKADPQLAFMASQHGMYTYRDLERFTGFFQDILIRKSDSLKWPVAFLAESSDMLVFSIAACWQLGVPFIPLDPKTPQDELERQIHELSPSLIFCDSANRKRLKGDDVVHMDENFFLNSFTFDVRHLNLPDPSKIDPEEVFGYFFTSGTSGTPKIVPLKRRQMLAAAKSSAKNFKPEANHFWLLCLPLNHVGGITIILRSLIYKSAIYRMNVFHEEMIKEFLSQNTQFQAASLVPTMLKRLLDDPLFRTHNKFKAVLIGGGPSNEGLLRRAAERGIPLVSSYGMTETCAQIVANPMHIPSGTYTPIKSVGKPFPPNQLEIRDENCKKLGMNESGSIWLKGPQVFDGYYQSDVQPFDEHEWFNTGDYGHLNGFGQLFIESRRTDLIITGGENVNPAIVEQALLEMSEIEEAVVVGLPDEYWGQKLVTAVRMKEGEKLELGDLKKALNTKLRDYQIPKDLRIVDEFPKTSTGKIKRKAVQQLFDSP